MSNRVKILGKLFIVALVGIFGGVSVAEGAEVAEPNVRLSLSGEHRFSAGDNPEWSRFDFDDSNWQTIPILGRWDSDVASFGEWIGWYRIRFQGEPWMREIQPAVFLGQINDADETWLNGERIGGFGKIPGHGSEDRSYSTAPTVNRVYRMPSELIRIGEQNVIAVRVMRIYSGGGIQSSVPQLEPGISDYRNLMLKVERSEGRSDSVYAILILFYVVAAAVGFSLFNDRELRKPYAWLGCLMLIFAGAYAFAGTAAARNGILTPTVELIANLAVGAAQCAFLNLMAHLLRQDFPSWLKWLSGGSAGFYLVAVLVCGPELRSLIYTASVVLIIPPVLVVPWWSVVAIRQRVPAARTLVTGLTVFATSVLLLFFPTAEFGVYWGVSPDAFGAAFLVICCLVVLMFRFRTLRRQVDYTAQALLVAQEDERRRLSRELHDGANQSIFAMRLALQMAHEQATRGEPVDSSSLAELIQETENVSDELRRIVSELRPSVLEQMPLVDALRWHADEMSNRSELKIDFSAVGEASVSDRAKDHLFRICQEAVQNTIQHAEATNLAITLTGSENWVELRMADDGRGMKTLPPSKNRGHGLSTIIERAELLGGTAVISGQSRRSGFSIIVRVPSDG